MSEACSMLRPSVEAIVSSWFSVQGMMMQVSPQGVEKTTSESASVSGQRRLLGSRVVRAEEGRSGRIPLSQLA